MRRSVLIALMGLVGLVPSASGAKPKPTSPALGTPRILYTSGWSGSKEIYSVDPARRAPIGQITFGREPGCRDLVLPCGFGRPFPSPDGRHVAFVGLRLTDGRE